MSDFQFKIYEAARQEEREIEKKRRPVLKDLFEESSSTYRIFSRLYCNFVMNERPRPEWELKQAKKEE
jgi:hypothetical protein